MFPGLVLLAIGCSSPAPQPVPRKKAAAPNQSAVKVITRKEGNTTRFLVDNRELCEVTMSFEMDLVNLKPSVSLPFTASFPPGQVTEAFSLTPANPDDVWSFTYTNYHKLGCNRVRHDDRCVYELPFEPGDKVEVTQGYDGEFSHKGPNRFAIDWKMPEGTLIRAARGGLVVRTKEDSNRGGGSVDYDRHNNYVLIRHTDGTLGHYCHLQKDGVLVEPGQTVAPGDPIARSGNTGFSTGPHLHFAVFMARSGRERTSIPVKFRTSEAPALTLVSGQSYEAASLGFSDDKVPGSNPFPKGIVAQNRNNSRAGSKRPVSVGVAALNSQN